MQDSPQEKNIIIKTFKDFKVPNDFKGSKVFKVFKVSNDPNDPNDPNGSNDFKGS